MLDILLINIFDVSSHLGHTTSLWNKLGYPGFTNEETPKVTQPVSDRAEIRTQAIWFPEYVLCTALHRGLLGEGYKGLTSITQPFPFALITIPSSAFLWGGHNITASWALFSSHNQSILLGRYREAETQTILLSPALMLETPRLPAQFSLNHGNFVFYELSSSYLQVS